MANRETSMTHIMDQVADRLLETGFKRQAPDVNRFDMVFPTGGAYGLVVKTVVIDDTGRWLETVDGWGYVQCCVDLRRFPDDPEGAIREVLA